MLYSDIRALKAIKLNSKLSTQLVKHLRSFFALMLCISSVSILANDLLSVKFVNNDVGYISGKNGYLVKTTDGGNVWNRIETNLPYDIWDVCSMGEDILITACSNGKILKTVDGGLSWESKIEDVSGSMKNIFFTYDTRLIACGENSNLLISYDYGESWEEIPLGVSSDLNKILFIDPWNGYIVGSNGTLLLTTDGGITWEPKMYSASRTNFRGISMTDDKTGTITGDDGLIFNTSTGWQSWKIYQAPSRNNSISEIKYINSTDAVAACGNFILMTTNNGRNWTHAESPFINYGLTLNSMCFTSASKGFIAGSAGILLTTTNYGQSWNYIILPAAGKNQQENPNKQSVEDIYISQNYPNPFNPSTVISYTIPGDSHVKIKVFDITGKEVSSLVNENKSAGDYTVKFNASQLPSGVYFYTITVNNSRQSSVRTMKMLLIK